MTRNAFAEYEELCKQTREQAALKQRLIRMLQMVRSKTYECHELRSQPVRKIVWPKA